MIYAKDSTNSTVISEDFYPNGILKEKGILDEIGSRRAPLGLWQYYDSTGVLTKTENFVYPTKKRPYWVKSEYYDNGKPKSEKQFYYDLEGESDTIEPKGIWKYYDKQGNVTKTEKY
jgi:antitoxin component YwqK of YwqJK toxin-antitoxin module